MKALTTVALTTTLLGQGSCVKTRDKWNELFNSDAR
jgi:hypothetical protein